MFCEVFTYNILCKEWSLFHSYVNGLKIYWIYTFNFLGRTLWMVWSCELLFLVQETLRCLYNRLWSIFYFQCTFLKWITWTIEQLPVKCQQDRLKMKGHITLLETQLGVLWSRLTYFLKQFLFYCSFSLSDTPSTSPSEFCEGLHSYVCMHGSLALQHLCWFLG